MIPLILAFTMCSTVAGADERAYCHAVATGDVGRCYAVSGPDFRAMCRAEVTGNPSSCETIPDDNLRNACHLRASVARRG